MASRSGVRWFWRDARALYGLIVCALVGGGLLAYVSGGVAWRGAAPAPARVVSDDELYTGAIVVVPEQGNRCWQMMLDNRTGRMWEGGYMDCDAYVDALADTRRTGGSTQRMNEIGAAFRSN